MIDLPFYVSREVKPGMYNFTILNLTGHKNMNWSLTSMHGLCIHLAPNKSAKVQNELS